MRYHTRVGLKLVAGAMSLALALVACGEPTPPTRGPVQASGGQQDSGKLTLSASTNCALLGETLTFTLQVKNTATYPLEFTGPPLFDMTIKRVGQPQVRWSETDQYPATINPVMAPGEIRDYQWQWVSTIEGVFTLEVQTAALPPKATFPNGGSASLVFGVNWMEWSPGSIPGRISCADLK
jgi:hypothetical protein